MPGGGGVDRGPSAANAGPEDAPSAPRPRPSFARPRATPKVANSPPPPAPKFPQRAAFTLDLVTRRKQPPTPTSVLEPAPSSPASSAASSVAGSVSGRPPSAPGDAAGAPDEAAPAVLLHRRSIVVAYRSPADPARAPADIPAATPNSFGQAALAVVTLALFFG